MPNLTVATASLYRRSGYFYALMPHLDIQRIGVFTMSEASDYSRWKRDASVAAGSGLVATLLMAGVVFMIGRVTSDEARVLLEAILPTSRFMCSAVMTAAATILALMLTLLGMSINSDLQMKPLFYRRIQEIAFYDMLVLIMAILFLVIHCIPITKSDDIPPWWYSTAYYTVLTLSAILAGAVISIVMMLYTAIRDIIHTFGLEEDTGLVRDSSETESESSSY
ncbi:hypothetical protein [Adhaeretor mobilis]|uniref:Uncharacterized protein n=1 Tax=Adhaeretor mobilis TaxID=1930276 RepID=A0A517N0R4_9BACT|nr:hypothetical protein [Adhaeretor mobilis]QDT00723.1 hypothetical protein HG15A2_40630 [Adhaeretor mobilis]